MQFSLSPTLSISALYLSVVYSWTTCPRGLYGIKGWGWYPPNDDNDWTGFKVLGCGYTNPVLATN